MCKVCPLYCVQIDTYWVRFKIRDERVHHYLYLAGFKQEVSGVKAGPGQSEPEIVNLSLKLIWVDYQLLF